MNILFISPNSPVDSIGGVERYISNLINYCKDAHDNTVYIVLPTYAESYIEKIGNVTIYFE